MMRHTPQDKKGRLDPIFFKQGQERLGVAPDPALDGRYFRKWPGTADMIPVFHIDGQGVFHS